MQLLTLKSTAPLRALMGNGTRCYTMHVGSSSLFIIYDIVIIIRKVMTSQTTEEMVLYGVVASLA